MTIDFNRADSFHFVNGDWAVNDDGDFACVLAVSDTLDRDTESWECYRYAFLNDRSLQANGRVLEVEPTWRCTPTSILSCTPCVPSVCA